MWPRLVLLATVLTRCGRGLRARRNRIVAALRPGGGIDMIARLLAPRLTQAYGKPVVVDNRAGSLGRTPWPRRIRPGPPS